METTELITAEQLGRVMPGNLKGNLNKELLEQINSTLNDPLHYETFRDNFLSYTNVLTEGRFKILDYVNAVKYVSHKLMGNSNIEAYTKTFPERYQRLIDNGTSDKDIHSHVTAYNKNKLVNLILEQSIIPSWILNQDLYQKALNAQALLMTTAKSEKVRSDAADSLLKHLKMPETQKVELDIGVKVDKSVDMLKQATMALAEQQRQNMISGSMNAKEIAHSKVIIEAEDVEYINHEDA